MKPAVFSIERETEAYLLIRDEGPWDRHATITNDAEGVVKRLVKRLAGRGLYYIDSQGDVDEIVVRNGKFAGFYPGGPKKW